MLDVVDPANILESLAKLQRQKDEEYGASWRKFGPLMAALFPDGVTLLTPEDHARFAVFIWMLSKVSRYAANFSEGGHADSVKDLAVYAAMLGALDGEGGSRRT